MLQQALEALLKGHGLAAAPYEDWVVVDGRLPGIRATVADPRRQEGRVLLRLDVEVALSADEVILESFVGLGEDESAALGNALQNFCVNSFHVFLAAFWNHVETDQVLVEDWQVGGQAWRAVIGNFGCQSAGGAPVQVPDAVFPTLESHIKALPLAGACHWMRSFHCNIDGEETCTEVLLDNAPWPEAQAAVAALDWPRTDGYYSARNFLVLQRV